MYLPIFPYFFPTAPLKQLSYSQNVQKRKWITRRVFFFSQMHGSLQLLVTMQVTILVKAWLASCWCCLKRFTSEITMTPLTLRIIRMSTTTGSFRELSLLLMQCTETRENYVMCLRPHRRFVEEQTIKVNPPKFQFCVLITSSTLPPNYFKMCQSTAFFSHSHFFLRPY